MSDQRNSPSEQIFDLAITGGTVVLPDGPPARINVGVRGQLTAWLGTEAPRAQRTVDATAPCNAADRAVLWRGRSLRAQSFSSFGPG